MSDTQLKAALAKMLPEILEWVPFEMEGDIEHEPFLAWRGGDEVLDTELLKLCHDVEETLDHIEKDEMARLVGKHDWWLLLHASWQQRATALAKVKGIEL